MTLTKFINEHFNRQCGNTQAAICAEYKEINCKQNELCKEKTNYLSNYRGGGGGVIHSRK